jgi:hypothetical protein
MSFPTALQFGRSPRLAAATILALLAGGCASNAFKDSYHSSLERWPSGEVSRIAPEQGNIEVVTTQDLAADSTRMMEAGYLLLGQSKFREEVDVSSGSARDLARDLHASVVLLNARYAKTLTRTIPIERWAPIRHERNARGALLDVASLRGESRLTYLPHPIDYYDYAATFWAKSKPPIFGVLIEGHKTSGHELDPKGMPIPGLGVVVRAVIHDSPAESAGVRGDDVIVRFAGTEMSDADQFFDTVVANKGRAIDVELFRAAESKTIKVSVRLRDE